MKSQHKTALWGGAAWTQGFTTLEPNEPDRDQDGDMELTCREEPETDGYSVQKVELQFDGIHDIER